MSTVKNFLRWLLAIFLISVGILHFVSPSFFLKIMPPYLPWHYPLVLVSGACEILIGLLLFVPGMQRWAAWGAISLFIAVFPANIYLYQHQELLPAPPLVHLLRLPLQAVFILWAYSFTRSGSSAREKSG